MSQIKNSNGQAVIEYLLLFSFMALFGMNLAKMFGGALGKSVGTFSYVLTNELSTGHCKSLCFGYGYQNNQVGTP